MRRSLLVFALFFLFSAQAHALGQSSKSVGLNLVSGVPELLGMQLTYVGIRGFTLGAGFGMLPINSALNRQVVLSPVPVTLSSGGPYTMIPSATYRMNSVSVLARWFPWEGNFFTQLGFAQLSAGGSVNGNIRNESNGAVSYGAMTGDLKLRQPMLNFGVGWEFHFLDGLFANFGLGVSYLLRTNYSLSLGGTLSSVAPLDPAAGEAFESSTNQIRDQVDQGVQKIEDATRLIPNIFLGIGWAFDLG